jgi:dTDP-glucose 4,6-dehydratase
MDAGGFLVTGGTGFFGRAMLRYWMSVESSDIDRIVVISRSPKKFLIEHPEFGAFNKLQLLEGDISKPESLPALKNITYVIHAATDSTNGPSLSPLERFEQILHGTENILKYAVRCGARRFLLTSSGGVYGAQPQNLERIPEEYLGIPDPLNPNNAYSIAKRSAEHLCALYQESFDIDVVIARCFAFVGQDLPLDVHFAIGNFIRDAMAGTDINVSGDGSPIRSYMDQRDLAQWLVTLVKSGQRGAAYNVGSDQEISIHDLAHLVKDCINQNLNVNIANQKNDGSFRNRYVPSIELARRDVGLGLNFTLRESIIKVFETLKDGK